MESNQGGWGSIANKIPEGVENTSNKRKASEVKPVVGPDLDEYEFQNPTAKRRIEEAREHEDKCGGQQTERAGSGRAEVSWR